MNQLRLRAAQMKRYLHNQQETSFRHFFFLVFIMIQNLAMEEKIVYHNVGKLCT